MALKRRKAYIPMPEEDQAKSSLPTDPNNQAFVPDGMWQKCPQCHQTILTDDLGAEKSVRIANTTLEFHLVSD